MVMRGLNKTIFFWSVHLRERERAGDRCFPRFYWVVFRSVERMRKFMHAPEKERKKRWLCV
jgi:hypothetical protein